MQTHQPMQTAQPIPPAPGTAPARAAGCTCPSDAERRTAAGLPLFIINAYCPIHGAMDSDEIRAIGAPERFVRLEDAKPLIKELAKDAPEPKPLYWLRHDEHGDHESDYCCTCANAVISWLTGGEKPAQVHEYQYHPIKWIGSKPEDIHVDGGWDTEDDGSRNCELCGCALAVSLTDYGVQSEIEHFEANGVSTPNEWREILVVVDAVEYVERSYAADAAMRSLYARTLGLINRYFTTGQQWRN